MAQHRGLLLELEKALDMLACVRADKDVLLDRFELALQRLGELEVTVHHMVEHGVEHIARPMPQEFGLGLAALAYTQKILVAVGAERYDEVAVDEDVDLAHADLAVHPFE